MFKFDSWAYRDDHNCWDFVREWLNENAGVPSSDVPKYGICPDNKQEMHDAAITVVENFIESGPVDHAIACHYRRGILFHVGIVYCGKVRHTGKKTGTRKDRIEVFERMAKTKYFLHKNLWP